MRRSSPPPVILLAAFLALTGCLDDPVAPEVSVEVPPEDAAEPGSVRAAALLRDAWLEAAIGDLSTPGSDAVRDGIREVLDRLDAGEVQAARSAIDAARSVAEDLRPIAAASADDLIAISLIDFVLLRAGAELAGTGQAALGPR